MRCYAFLVFINVFSLASCSQDKFVLMVEQPVKKSLDKKVLRISLGDEVVNDTLKYTDIVPTFKTYELEASNRNELLLQLDTVSLQLELTYPNDKYIIVSPSINIKGNTNIGVVKQAEKYILH